MSVNWGDSNSGGFVTWDERVQMWQAIVSSALRGAQSAGGKEALDKHGKYHRRWFTTLSAAKKWAASWEGK